MLKNLGPSLHQSQLKKLPYIAYVGTDLEVSKHWTIRGGGPSYDSMSLSSNKRFRMWGHQNRECHSQQKRTQRRLVVFVVAQCR